MGGRGTLSRNCSNFKHTNSNQSKTSINLPKFQFDFYCTAKNWVESITKHFDRGSGIHLA